MAPPSIPGHGQGPQPGRGPGLPGGVSAVPAGGRDGRLPAFADGGAGDRFPPGGWLAMMIDELSGPGRRCPAATDDELIGLLGRWAALESWAVAGKLGVLAELARRRARPGHPPRGPAAIPAAFEPGTGHEAAAALAVSLPAADNLITLACALQARLPGIYKLLAAGSIDYLKARIVAEATEPLDDAAATRAEALIMADLPGKTHGQVGRLAAGAVAAADPAGAQQRRERAQRENARVRFWREQAGTGALAAYGLPADDALAANANINARARAYKRARLEATMDQLRVLAFLDIINGIPAAQRIARARADAGQSPSAGQPAGEPPQRDDPADHWPAGHEPPDDECPDDEPPGSQPPDDGYRGDEPPPEPPDDGYRDGDRGADGTRDDEPGGDRPGGSPRDSSGPSGGDGSAGGPSTAPDAGNAGPALAASTNLTIPLATLQQLADRPGAAHGLGPLDPALARDLAAAAARSPHSQFCVTVTSPDGYAIGHGCARISRRHRANAPPDGGPASPWSFEKTAGPGPPGGYGTWTLTLPGGRDLTVKLGPVPVTDCDHRHESHGYQPSDTLRHLVQVRDGECTFPACSRHARDSDFEHALPYDQGGRTCACNAGARSRRCHQVKQSKGWSVTQPRPGWHQWRTPSGRTYTQGPTKYPS